MAIEKRPVQEEKKHEYRRNLEYPSKGEPSGLGGRAITHRGDGKCGSCNHSQGLGNERRLDTLGGTTLVEKTRSKYMGTLHGRKGVSRSFE